MGVHFCLFFSFLENFPIYVWIKFEILFEIKYDEKGNRNGTSTYSINSYWESASVIHDSQKHEMKNSSPPFGYI